MQRGGRGSPRPTFCAPRPAPGGRIRYRGTSRTSATPRWATPRPPAAGRRRLLLFRGAPLVCAADAGGVREIRRRLETPRTPGPPPPVAGLVNVRGTLIPVGEGGRALRQPEPPASNGTHHGTTVLLEVGGGRKVLGFTVDEVVDLLALGAEALERRQALPGIDPTLVRAVGRRAGQLFVVLDTDALLTPILSS